MKKIYVLDTNVLMYDPRSLFVFEDNEVIIPLVVLDELDKHKGGLNQAAKHARMAIKSLDELRKQGSLHSGVNTINGGKIRVEIDHKNNIPSDLDPDRADNRIISIALEIGKKYPDYRVIVITKDINLRVKCDALNVPAEDFISDAVVENIDSMYSGTSTIVVSEKEIDEFYKNSILDIDRENHKPYPNEYILLQSETNLKHSALAKYDGTKLVKVKSYNNIWGINSRNKEQVFALDALFDPNIKLVSITGRAGTGKTLLAAVAGVSQLLDHAIYKKIVLSRPVVSMGKDIGYLPGNIEEKMLPWLAPLYDNLDLIFSDQGRYYVENLMSSGKIEIQPLTYVRGRSLPKSYVLVDEAQQLTKHEIKALITRIGTDSKVVLTGDIEQIDTPYIDSVDNGLSCVVELFKDDPIAAHVQLTKGERSVLATKAAEKL